MPIPRELMLGTSEVYQFLETTRFQLQCGDCSFLHLHASDYSVILGDTHIWSNRLSNKFTELCVCVRVLKFTRTHKLLLPHSLFEFSL